MTRPLIGILRPGSTFEAMIDRFGDYERWFVDALEPTGAVGRLSDVVADPPPPPESADGWIVTGARSAVYDQDPWVERLMDWIREAHARGVPLLGVCYGHQAVCRALGGEVGLHPEGWEVGTVEVELTAAGREDSLFAGVPARFAAQTTHQDHVSALPPGAVVLAANRHTPVQAIAMGSSTRGVQFHPEVTTAIAHDFVDRRRHLLTAPPRVAEAPDAPRVLDNFVQGFVRRVPRAEVPSR